MRVMMVGVDGYISEWIRQAFLEEEIEVAVSDGAVALVSPEPACVLITFSVFNRLTADSIQKLSIAAGIIVLCPGGDVNGRILALELGAHDAIEEPSEYLGLLELAVRVRAVMRHVEERTEQKPSPQRPSPIRAGKVELDPNSRTVKYAGRVLDLTTQQHDILEILMRRMGQPVSQSALMEGIGIKAYSSQLPRMSAFRLRKALELQGCRGYLRTVRGRGYTFCVPAEERL